MARNQIWHYDVSVIGGGIAGLTAAAFVARAGKSVILFEQTAHVGGRGVTQNMQWFHFKSPCIDSPLQHCPCSGPDYSRLRLGWKRQAF